MDETEGESHKSRSVALLLCFFIGWFGGHRFYAGKMVTGSLMAVTMGGLGIWYFIDLVLISIGMFTDQDNLPITNWAF